MLVETAIPLSACHICRSAPVGQCLRCGRFYCLQHGLRFCAACRQAALDCRPWSVTLLARVLRAATILFFSLALLAGLAARYSLGRGVPSPMAGTLDFVAIILAVLAIAAWPLYLLGAALLRGSARARRLLLIVAFPALLLAPVGTILGLLTLRTLFDPDVMIWFDILNSPART